MKLRLQIVLGSAAVLAMIGGGCVTEGGIAPPVTPAMVAAARGTPEAILEEGRKIFAGPCASCHTADPVSKYTTAEWHRIVDDMAERTKLDSSRKAALMTYIVAAKKVETVPAQGASADSR